MDSSTTTTRSRAGSVAAIGSAAMDASVSYQPTNSIRGASLQSTGSLRSRSRAQSVDNSYRRERGEEDSSENSPRFAMMGRDRSQSAVTASSEDVEIRGITLTGTIFEILSTPVLKEAFKWHCVSVFSIENLFFIDKIDLDWRPLFVRKKVDCQEVRAAAEEIVKTFFGAEAKFEVNFDSKIIARVKRTLASTKQETCLNEDIFNNAYNLTMRDLHRSLNQFQTTPMYQSYLDHKNTVEKIFSESATSSVDEVVSLPYEEMLVRVRHLYRTTGSVMVIPMKEVIDGYNYQCTVGNEIRGYCKAAENTYSFYNMNDELLLIADAQVFLNKDKHMHRKMRERSHTDSNIMMHKKSIFGKKRNSSNYALTTASSTKEVYLKHKLKKEVYGPIPLSTVQLWFRYHIIKTECVLISNDCNGKSSVFRAFEEFGAEFDENNQIQMRDPTTAFLP